MSTSCITSKTPVGHRPVSRPFEAVAIELVEYEDFVKGFRDVSSHELPDSIFRQKTNRLSTVTRAFDEWSPVFSNLVKELHPLVKGLEKTRTLPHRYVGNPVIECVCSSSCCRNITRFRISFMYGRRTTLLRDVILGASESYRVPIVEIVSTVPLKI